jgi:proteic killer suppression protein
MALCTADDLSGWQLYLWLLYPFSLDGFDRLGYDSAMIKSFKDKETEKVFNGQFSRRLPRDVQRIAERKLIILHRAASLNDLRVPPSNRLEALRGQRTGQHSIRVNDQWRVCFEWREEGVYNVEIVDYH